MISKRMISTRAFLASLEVLKVCNQDVDAFFDQADIPSNLSNNLDNQISLSKLLAWINSAKTLINDDAIGLHAGEVIHPGCFGDMGLALLCCEKLKQVSEFAIEFSRLMGDATGSTITHTGNDVSYIETWDDCDPEEVKPLAEQNMVAALIFTQKLISEGDRTKLLPTQVKFQHAQPSYVSEYYRIFQCPVYFGQPVNEISFSNKIADFRVVSASPELHATIKSRLEKTKWELINTGFYQRVRQFVEERLSSHMPSINETAEHFNMNSKSLQRRLKNEDMTYRDLCQDLRKSIAQEWVGKSKRSLTEISNTLGYSSLSAFTRAFKEWYGMPPIQYRENIQKNVEGLDSTPSIAKSTFEEQVA